MISNGAKQSIHNALMAVCGPGDEVIIPAPYWVSYADLVKLTGATPVIITTTESASFKLTPDQFKAAVTPRTKLLMINSPSNPTGVVYNRTELEALADAVLQTDVGVLSDEIYEQLTYDDVQPTCFATLRPGLADRTITISGVSKTYAMTGWRIGWAIAALAGRKVHGRRAEPGDQQSLLGEPVGRPGGDHRAARFRGKHENAVPEAASICPGPHCRAARRDLPAARRCFLCVHEYLGSFRPHPQGQNDCRFYHLLHELRFPKRASPW